MPKKEDSRTGQPICGRKNKNCRKCKYRYPKGSKATKCPECNETRFCQSAKVHGLDTCRMHGDHKKAHPEPKFLLGPNLSKRVNRILAHPELYELANEIAANEARTEQLLQLADKFSYANWGEKIDRAVQEAHKAASFGERGAVLDALKAIEEARKEELSNLLTWAEIRETWKLHALLVRDRHTMMLEKEQMVSITQLLEVIVSVQRIIFKVIRSPEDRRYVGQEIRRLYGDGAES